MALKNVVYHPPVKVEADIYWAFLNTLNPTFNSDKYEVTLCNLSANAIKALEQTGANVKKKADRPEQGFHVVVKSTREIKAFDNEGSQITDKIANGSKCIALLTPYSYDHPQRKGERMTSVGAKYLKVTDLKIYNPVAVSTLDDDSDVL